MNFISKIRNILKKYFPNIYKKSEKARTGIYKTIFSKKVKLNLINDFFEYAPGGSGEINSINNNIIYNVKNISKTLLLLLNEDKDYKNLSNLDYDHNLATQLLNLFKKNGSDKYLHDYHYVYSYIISKNKINKMLEIGIGSQDSKILSNMGNFGTPGGCLRSFSEILDNDAEIIGLEIDKKALFNEKNIKSFEFDQLNKNQIDKFSDDNPNYFDLVIDDGLHSNISIINTIYMCKKILKNNGILVIEDLHEEQLEFLKIAFELSKQVFDYDIYKMNQVFIIIATKLI